jgi:hypothetical protein
MAIKTNRGSHEKFIVDNLNELYKVPGKEMGTEVFVIENTKTYMLNSFGSFIEKTNQTSEIVEETGFDSTTVFNYMLYGDKVDNRSDILETEY